MAEIAQDADDHIIYDAITGALYCDADGNGAGRGAVRAPHWRTRSDGERLHRGLRRVSASLPRRHVARPAHRIVADSAITVYSG